MRHVPVLLNEVISSLNLKPGDNVIDCTLGDGGHSEKILEITAPNGKLLGIDADIGSIGRAKKNLEKFGERVRIVNKNFSHLEEIVSEAEFSNVKGILMDLGWSSSQFENEGKGFSFRQEEPLNMRFENNGEPVELEGEYYIDAKDLVNNGSKKLLRDIFKNYGEENLSEEIALAIIDLRHDKEINTTTDLVNLVLEVYRKKLKTNKEIPWIGGLHPATKVFQALRIAINDELGVLEKTLPLAINMLEKGGRLSVITFHSLEDRIVKHFLQKEAEKNIKLVNKKPIICSEEEYKNNSKARSAKLRVAEKI